MVWCSIVLCCVVWSGDTWLLEINHWLICCFTPLNQTWRDLLKSSTAATKTLSPSLSTSMRTLLHRAVASGTGTIGGSGHYPPPSPTPAIPGPRPSDKRYQSSPPLPIPAPWRTCSDLRDGRTSAELDVCTGRTVMYRLNVGTDSLSGVRGCYDMIW